MAEYTLAHIGINTENADEARKAAKMFEQLFGLTVKEGNSSVFAGGVIECMKAPYKGTHGHIAIGTPDVAAAQAELEAKGIVFDPSTAKYKPDGTLNAIYLLDEVCGFAVHLVGSRS